MKRNNLWRLTIVLIVLFWSLYEMYPPRGRDLVEQFVTDARVAPNDTTFSNIVFQARELQKTNPDRGFSNLSIAIGTNNIVDYFPQIDARNETHPTTYILNRLQRRAAGKIRLGLDLQGGTSFLVEMDTSKLADTNEVTGALSQAVEVLRKRVDRFGVAEPVIQPAGDTRILIQLPGLSEEDRERAKAQIQKTAFLEFRLVHEQSDELIKLGEIPPGHEVLKRKERTRAGERLDQVVVKKRGEPGLTGSIVKRAWMDRGNLGEPEIRFELNSEGALRFGEVTRNNQGRRLAIVLDGELYSAPNIVSAIETGSGSITGSFDQQSARELAGVMENPLRAPLKILESNDVDPTLGADSVRSGMEAAIYGVILVAAFMLVYYLLAGVVANVALMLNIIILLGVMCSIGTTLTLPGIAGIVLTIGMAVDANVLIYERIREELAAGKSIRGGIASGYDKAFSTIFDSNLTTLIASTILIFMGTGPVKGFGVTLTIGVSVSMFTSLVVTRLVFDWMLGRDLIKHLKMFSFFSKPKLDFMRFAVPAFAASWLLIVIGNSYGVFFRGSDVMGVEFSGGTQATLNFDQSKDIGVDEIRKSVSKTGVGDVLIAYQKSQGDDSRTLMVTVRAVEGQEGSEAYAKVLTQLNADFPDAKFSEAALRDVGPTIGAELRTKAIYAALMALFMILVYVAFRYEFSFAVGAVVAVLHDILMTSGWYFLVGRELNATTVAALLTIIGFSINDTIVIFDRIREDLKLGVRGTFRELINQALNQTLSRTIITAGTVFLATLSLYFFGGGPVNDFAFTFLVGILTGTYSSIYIASAIVLWWHKGARPSIGAPPTVSAASAPATVKV